MSKRPPQRAKRPCLVGSCKEYADNGGYCDKHQDKIKKKDRERGTAHRAVMVLSGINNGINF